MRNILLGTCAFFVAMLPQFVNASAMIPPTCFVNIRIINYVEKKIAVDKIVVNKKCPVQAGDVFQAYSLHPRLSKIGAINEIGVRLGSSMGTEAAVSFLDWSKPADDIQFSTNDKPVK